MIQVLLRTLLVYIMVVLAIRVMGKRQIGDMQPGDLVITILISQIAALPACEPDFPILHGIGAVAMLVLLEWISSLITLKSVTVRRFMNGRSAVLIRDGKIDQKALKKQRVSLDDLLEMLRVQSVFDVSEVAYGILENNGTLSILLRASKCPATPEDLSLSVELSVMPIPLITDGILRKEKLDFAHIREADVRRELEKKALTVREVFLMTADQNGQFDIIKKEP